MLPIIACKNLAFNQRRCVESVGNLVWALTRTANYSKQGKFVSLVWEDAVGVQSKGRTLNDNLFCSEAKNFFPSMLKSPWNFASSEAGLMTGWLSAVYIISHIKTGFQLKHRSFFTNNIQPDDWKDGMCTSEIFFVATTDDKLNFKRRKVLNWLTVWILRIYCSVISFRMKIIQEWQNNQYETRKISTHYGLLFYWQFWLSLGLLRLSNGAFQ